LHTGILTIQIVRRNQEFQAQLRRYVHIRDILAFRVLLVVVQVFADLL
jgi:hypothetical protein